MRLIMAAVQSTSSSSNIRVRINLSSFTEEGISSPCRQWMLINVSLITLISDLENSIKTRFIPAFSGNVTLKLDGYILPSYESIHILRDNDLIVVEISTLEQSESGKKKKRKRSINQETSEDITQTKKFKKVKKTLRKQKVPECFDEVDKIDSDLTMRDETENNDEIEVSKTKKNKKKCTNSLSSNTNQSLIVEENTPEKYVSKKRDKNVKNNKTNKLPAPQNTEHENTENTQTIIESKIPTPIVDKAANTKKQAKPKKPQNKSSQEKEPSKKDDKSKTETGVNNKTVEGHSKDVLTPESKENNSSINGKKHHIRFSSSESDTSSDSSTSTSSSSAPGEQLKTGPSLISSVTDAVLQAQQARDKIVKVLQQKGGPARFKQTPTLPSCVANRKPSNNVLTNISYIFKNTQAHNPAITPRASGTVNEHAPNVQSPIPAPPTPVVIKKVIGPVKPTEIIGPLKPTSTEEVLKDYNSMVPLLGPPRVGDKIAYKIIEMSSNYTPLISEYRQALVTAVDPDTNQLQLESIGQEKSVTENIEGRFEMDLGEDFVMDHQQDTTTSTKQVYLTELIEPRILP